MPEWLLNWSQESLIFIVVLTFVAVILLKLPLRTAILVDFGYMIMAFPFAWQKRHRHQ
ncbi:hypothetical protein [Lactobacillus sp. CBA3606]|uniref:hypothetical protein n=1 Tax=Lactobacillus sp. CBA3606 TaxID=2099789 RepID=UPI0018F89A04|nr:hypothetical protein [Lactobacillus sp. CBA3606]